MVFLPRSSIGGRGCAPSYSAHVRWGEGHPSWERNFVVGSNPNADHPQQLLASQLFDEFSVLGVGSGEFRSLGQLEIREVETRRYGAAYKGKSGRIFQPGGKPTAPLHYRLKNFAGLECIT